MRLIIRAMLFLSLGAVAWAQPPLFQDLTFEKAQARATANKKWLLVDATATWCGPCKKMDKTTWVDRQLTAYCAKRVLAIQIDVDEQKTLARRLHVDGMPTVILFRDGKELDRFVGYREPKELLAWFELVAAGKRDADALAEKAKKGDIQARMEWADDLLREGKPTEATTQYLWLWDHMLEKEPAMVGVRHSFFRHDLETLVRKVPQARKPLEIRLAKLRSKVEKGESDVNVLTDWITLSEVLDGGKSALQYALQVQGTKRAASLKRVEDHFSEKLQGQGRWAEAGRLLSDPQASVNQALALEKSLALMPEDMRSEMKEYARKSASKKLLAIFRSYVAAGRKAEAEIVKQVIVKRDPATQNALKEIERNGR